MGGGSFLTVKLPGLPTVVKDFLSIKTTQEMAKAELNEKKLEQYNKALELKRQLDAQGMTVDELQRYMDTLVSCSASMQIQPIENIAEPSIFDADNVLTDDEEETS